MTRYITIKQAYIGAESYVMICADTKATAGIDGVGNMPKPWRGSGAGD